MNNHTLQHFRQRGAALLISLIILLMITLMGVSALKSGIFQEMMAFNAQAEEMSFHAAETGINAIVREARTNNALLNDLIDAGNTATEHCVTLGGGLQEANCGAGETIDERAAIVSEVSSHFDSKKILLGSDADYFKDYQFVSEGNGRFVQASMPFSTTNYQEWRKVGPASGQFSDESGMMDYSQNLPGI